MVAEPVEDQPQVAEVQSQEPTLASPSNCPTPWKLGKSLKEDSFSPPRKGVRFSLGIAQKTSSVQIGWEGTSSDPIQVEDQPTAARAEPEVEPG